MDDLDKEVVKIRRLVDDIEPASPRVRRLEQLSDLSEYVAKVVKTTVDQDDEVPRRRYAAYLTNLDKTFNTNRMPSWWELSEKQKNEWRNKS